MPLLGHNTFGDDSEQHYDQSGRPQVPPQLLLEHHQRAAARALVLRGLHPRRSKSDETWSPTEPRNFRFKERYATPMENLQKGTQYGEWPGGGKNMPQSEGMPYVSTLPPGPPPQRHHGEQQCFARLCGPTAARCALSLVLQTAPSVTPASSSGAPW